MLRVRGEMGSGRRLAESAPPSPHNGASSPVAMPYQYTISPHSHTSCVAVGKRQGNSPTTDEGQGLLSTALRHQHGLRQQPRPQASTRLQVIIRTTVMDVLPPNQCCVAESQGSKHRLTLAYYSRNFSRVLASIDSRSTVRQNTMVLAI